MFKKIGLIGYGSFGREILCNIHKSFDIFFFGNYNNINLNEIEQKYNCNCYDISKFDFFKYKALITITNGDERKDIINYLPKKTEYYTYIDENAILMDKNNINIGEGSIICAGTILTTNLKLGKFTQLNLSTTIGHDTELGNFCTTAPGVNISGNCKIGNNVYFGTNSSIKPNIKIVDNVIIGLNSGVVKNISESGIYIGTPSIKFK
jgi:sugar O-acyltransferase (sialic acid O-acetyltransferase NeuD family)